MSIKAAPLIGKFLKELESDTKKSGLQAASLKAVKRTGTRLKKFGNAPETGPTLVVANHPHDAEVLALLASLPDRPDIFIVINHIYMKASETLSKHFIPVYLTHHVHEGRPVTLSGRIVDFLLKPEKLTPDQEHELNIKSIDKAAELINKGGMVVLFPEKRYGERRWQPGLGHLLKKVDGKTKLVFAHISGTSRKDYLRLIPGAAKMLPEIKVAFHQLPIEINTALSARETAQEYEKMYIRHFK